LKYIAIFASGSGSNARKLLEYFDGRAEIEISVILTNKVEAGVTKVAADFQKPVWVINKTELENAESFLPKLLEFQIDVIVLAGFLLKIPEYLIRQFPDRIINLHPALLPKFGGKGMYGLRVHRAVIQTQEKESGITIHLVNEHYDEGRHLFQAKCEVLPTDTPEELAKRVQQLEHSFFPKVIDEYLTTNSASNFKYS
jgi:phosphoribosylglycinamide formyltransferase-1